MGDDHARRLEELLEPGLRLRRRGDEHARIGADAQAERGLIIDGGAVILGGPLIDQAQFGFVSAQELRLGG